MFLKISVLALLVFSAYAGSEETWKAAMEKCAAESGADPKEFEKFIENKNTAVDRSIKCFGACVLKEMGTMDDDGTFNLEKAIEEVPEDMSEKEKIIEGLTACAEKKGEDDCETAHLIFMCFHEKNIL